MTGAIPTLIHQIYIHPSTPGKSPPPEILANIDHLKRQNPGYTHHLYEDAEIANFIRDEYGAAMLAAYDRISPHYPAAKADFFRYLLLYRRGGIYLDMKSTTTRPLADVLRPDDRFVLAHWPNRPGEPYEGWGTGDTVFPGLPEGEFQQWHVIAAPGHPFLAAVIEAVQDHIRRYTPWRYGVGPAGTLHTTGPVCYTRAIQPILDQHPHRIVRTHDEIGLRYSIYDQLAQHRALAPTHYRLQNRPVVRPANPASAALYYGYIQAWRIQRKLRRGFR